MNFFFLCNNYFSMCCIPTFGIPGAQKFHLRSINSCLLRSIRSFSVPTKGAFTRIFFFYSEFPPHPFRKQQRIILMLLPSAAPGLGIGKKKIKFLPWIYLGLNNSNKNIKIKIGVFKSTISKLKIALDGSCLILDNLNINILIIF